ncbi:AIR synthase [Synechococcus sp. RSCCF101]|uniref:AIR synthase n=1 Tax=Synechococcus sp. RSCCF101 TaxID=2511069 RepID=UPI001244AB2D|nr:AIR synthase [Synechococcus sp. RSCCF101]QEY32221.1 AIR synthase [Synechococcus sp. RSCCF101]
MPRGHSLRLTATAAAELGRLAAVAGTPGLMHLDLLEGACERHVIRIRPGHLAGVPVARADGITLHSPADQVDQLTGLSLDYRGDLSGGGFLIRAGRDVRCCPCGAAFTRAGTVGQ